MEGCAPADVDATVERAFEVVEPRVEREKRPRVKSLMKGSCCSSDCSVRVPLTLSGVVMQE